MGSALPFIQTILFDLLPFRITVELQDYPQPCTLHVLLLVIRSVSLYSWLLSYHFRHFSLAGYYRY